MTDPVDDFADAGHSLFAPSASAGWLTCPGYLAANRRTGDKGAGIYAAEGTVFHAVMERWLIAGEAHVREGDTVRVPAGGEDHVITVDAEMLAHAAECIRRTQHLRGVRLVERLVDFSRIMPIPGQKGTCDLAVMSPGRLSIRDWKYGKGVRVDARDNTQLQLYALGVFFEHDELFGFETVNVGICQPRLDHFPEWEVSREELLAFAEHVRDRAALAYAALQGGEGPRVPTPKACMWCRAKAVCPARAVTLERLAIEGFDDLEAPDPGREVSVADMERVTERVQRGHYGTRLVPARELTTAQLARILPHRRAVETWFNAIGDELLRRAERGEKVPGWHLAEGRSKREWADLEHAERELLKLGLKPNEFYEISPISPAQAEALVRQRRGVGKSASAKLVEPLVVRPPGKTTLVRVGDPRPELDAVAGSFDDETL